MKKELSIAFQTDKRASEYIALAKLVNQYDFDVVTVYCDAPYQPSFGALLLMAPHIQRARIGASAIAPSRMHPIDIASQTALLADLASGGVYMGLARGAWLKEHGIREIQPPIQGIREAVNVFRYMLAGRSDGYQGQVFQLAPGVRAPYPLPEQKIPILIGSWGEKLCALAGEIADEVKVGGSANPDIVAVIKGYIAKGEAIAHREPNSVGVVLGAVSVIDENRDLARLAVKRSLVLYLPVVVPLDPTVSVEPELIQRLKVHADNHTFDEGAKLISDDLLKKFAFAGNPNDFIEHAQQLFEMGATRIEFGTPHGLEKPETGIRLLGEKVLPILRRDF